MGCDPERKLNSELRKKLASDLRREGTTLRHALGQPGVRDVFTKASLNIWSIRCMYRILQAKEIEESIIRDAINNVEMVKWFFVPLVVTNEKVEGLVKWIKQGERSIKA